MRNQRLILVASVAALVIPTQMPVNSALGATGRQSISVSGAGAKKAGREVTARFVFTNTSVNPSLAPERLNTIVLKSRVLRFNSRARRFRRCGARLPKDGRPARCPRASKIGNGSFGGIFGQPGQSVNLLGVLSPVSGSITLYNYRPGRGQQAWILAIMKTRTPLAGISINLLVPVSRRGTITIDVPDVPQLPPAIPAALPPGSRFILTRLSTTAKAKREKRGRPYISLRSLKRLDFAISAYYE